MTRLVGISFGGLIAQAFTLRYPDRVRRLALLATVAGRTPAERRTVLARAETLAAGGAVGTVEAALDRWYTPEFPRPIRSSSRRRESACSATTQPATPRPTGCLPRAICWSTSTTFGAQR